MHVLDGFGGVAKRRGERKGDYTCHLQKKERREKGGGLHQSKIGVIGGASGMPVGEESEGERGGVVGQVVPCSRVDRKWW